MNIKTEEDEAKEIARLLQTNAADTIEILGTTNSYFIDSIRRELKAAMVMFEQYQDNARDTVYIKAIRETPENIEKAKKIVYEVIEEEWQRTFQGKLESLGTKK
jgi:hypothetical protein